MEEIDNLLNIDSLYKIITKTQSPTLINDDYVNKIGKDMIKLKVNSSPRNGSLLEVQAFITTKPILQ